MYYYYNKILGGEIKRYYLPHEHPVSQKVSQVLLSSLD